MPGLCCLAWAFSSRSEQLLSIAVHRLLSMMGSLVEHGLWARGFRSCGFRVLVCAGFSSYDTQGGRCGLQVHSVRAQRRWHMGTAAPRGLLLAGVRPTPSYPLARGLLLARGQTHALCIGRWILIHWHVDSSRPGVRPTPSALAGGFLSTGTWNPPSQGSDPHPLHWQVDSYPLHHQGSPVNILILTFPTGVRQYHIVVLICISLLVSSIEHLFMCFLAICMINL